MRRVLIFKFNLFFSLCNVEESQKDDIEKKALELSLELMTRIFLLNENSLGNPRIKI